MRGFRQINQRSWKYEQKTVFNKRLACIIMMGSSACYRVVHSAIHTIQAPFCMTGNGVLMARLVDDRVIITG